ncbi:hypothetical protein IE81DRAFT_369446 [Ceraceosorus guamensis]|uniref:Uncharacterized protein n=1 Tax=Ceraceosorus guamensis TaxID=1522189 RepID=A0A316VN37_9BASI|nr:hypothetical protein IE81DRAFT_369446 [Ceraceosorus guamensis]PWN38976.1 hypothetical protein IE81DRAFT_369446 [Ceraceosorus guamensis]
MKLFSLTTSVGVALALLGTASEVISTPLFIPTRQQQVDGAARIISSNPLLVKHCKAYLKANKYQDKLTTVTTTATVTATSTPAATTLTATETATTTTTTTVSVTPSLFYPNNAPPGETYAARRRDLEPRGAKYVVPVPAPLKPWASIIFDACVKAVYPPPRPTSTVTSTVTVSTTLAAATVTTTTTTTSTQTATTTTVVGGLQSASPPPPAKAGDVVSYFRVEGTDRTIYEGYVSTSGKDITTPSGGTHRCDGTNNNANSFPSGTFTTLINDAPLDFDGSYSNQFSDFFITSIGGLAQTGSKFWGVLRNGVFTNAGGCQEQVYPNANDEAMWLYDAFQSNKALLRASLVSSSALFTAGQGFVDVQVDQRSPNGGSSSPAGSATIGGVTTNGDGRASIPVPSTPGYYAFKATRGNDGRSNSVLIYVVGATA